MTWLNAAYWLLKTEPKLLKADTKGDGRPFLKQENLFRMLKHLKYLCMVLSAGRFMPLMFNNRHDGLDGQVVAAVDVFDGENNFGILEKFQAQVSDVLFHCLYLSSFVFYFFL